MNNCTKCAPGTVVPAPEYNKAGSCNQPACSLHTVIIPKAKGSDAPGQPYAPILGGYQNTILVYEATGSVYLYDENGVFTNLTGNSILPVIEALKQQVEASTEQVNTLDSTLTAEIANRQSADVDLQSLITTLQSSLNTETTARESADTTLTNNYNELKAQVNSMSGDSSTEAEAREAADANLQEQINTLQTDLTSETAAREAADNTLTNSVDNLQASIETLTTKVENATGKSGNLPDSLVQQVLVNSNPTGNNVTIQATDLDLTTGATSSTVGTISYKTVGGQSILGEGDIPVSGGSSTALPTSFVSKGQLGTPNEDWTVTGTMQTIKSFNLSAGTYLVYMMVRGLTPTAETQGVLRFSLSGVQALDNANNPSILDISFSTTSATAGHDTQCIEVSSSTEVSLRASVLSALNITLKGNATGSGSYALLLVPTSSSAL